jgi:hypothetical protein
MRLPNHQKHPYQPPLLPLPQRRRIHILCIDRDHFDILELLLQREQRAWNEKVAQEKKNRGLRSPSFAPLRGFCLIAYYTMMRPTNNRHLEWEEITLDAANGASEGEGCAAPATRAARSVRVALSAAVRARGARQSCSIFSCLDVESSRPWHGVRVEHSRFAVLFGASHSLRKRRPCDEACELKFSL